MDELVSRFCAQAVEAGSEPHLLESWADVAALARSLAGGGRVALSPALAQQHPEITSILGPELLLPDEQAPFSSVADVPVGVLAGFAGVVETGSVALALPGLGDRAVMALARRAIHVVRRADLCPTLDEYAQRVEVMARQTSLITLVTGPSRTADIERSLTIGVQGPETLHVVVLA